MSTAEAENDAGIVQKLKIGMMAMVICLGA
jgi:hypothetical protein